MTTNSSELPGDCRHRPPCPGCPRWGEVGLPAELLGRIEACADRLGVAVGPVRQGRVAGYRKRSRLAVRGSSRRPQIGIFERGTHQVVDVPECVVHDPLINQVVDAFRRSIVSTATPVYQEPAHVGFVRYLQVVVERASRRAQVVVVANSRSADAIAPLLSDFAQRLGPSLHSLWFNGQTEQANHILGPHWERVQGPAAVEEAIGGARVFFPPGAFGQANLDLADEIVEQIHSWVVPEAPVVELYSGVGAIGLGLLASGRNVVFNEVTADSLLGLRLGLEQLEPAVRERARVVEGPAEVALDAIDTLGAQVIVDPPRKGLHPDVVSHLLRAPPRSLIYLGCGFPSFERDAGALVQGGFRCQELLCYDLFPLSDHVETLARFVLA